MAQDGIASRGSNLTTRESRITIHSFNPMKFHVALSVADIEASVGEYSKRLKCAPQVVVRGEYALWRTETLNFSSRKTAESEAGKLRHVGWEDSDASAFEVQSDINGVLWERFSADQQRDEILSIWPTATDYLKNE